MSAMKAEIARRENLGEKAEEERERAPLCAHRETQALTVNSDTASLHCWIRLQNRKRHKDQLVFFKWSCSTHAHVAALVQTLTC